jgi:hypothetical protein
VRGKVGYPVTLHNERIGESPYKLLKVKRRAGREILQETKAKPELSQASVDEIRRAIREIDSLDFKLVSIDEIKERLFVLFRGFTITTPVFEPGLTLYRARVFDSNRPRRLSDIAAPPSNKVTRNQRCNRAGESMFYSSTGRNAPFFECHVEPGQYVALSKWGTTKRLLVNNVAYTADTFGRLKSARECPTWRQERPGLASKTEANRLVGEFLSSAFSLDVKKEEEYRYKLTIAITEKLIPSEMFGGLLYPTIPMNGNADNFALKGDFVSSGLAFVRVEYMSVRSVEGMNINIDVLDSATAIDDTGGIEWKGRTGQWNLTKVGEHRVVAENGEWVVRDPSGNTVEPE